MLPNARLDTSYLHCDTMLFAEQYHQVYVDFASYDLLDTAPSSSISSSVVCVANENKTEICDVITSSIMHCNKSARNYSSSDDLKTLGLRFSCGLRLR